MTLFRRWYRHVWGLDFEFIAAPGEHPKLVAVVFVDFATGREVHRWLAGKSNPLPPVDLTDPRDLFVAYAAVAECSCLLELGWPIPPRIIDLYFEFKRLRNGRSAPHGHSLLGALATYGIRGMSQASKDDMRSLILRGGPWAPDEKRAIMNYCREDVVAMRPLLEALGINIVKDSHTHMGALLRGRYAAAVARMERSGVPMDMPLLNRLKRHWEAVKLGLVRELGPSTGAWDEEGKFSSNRFGRWLFNNDIAWPRLASGKLDLQADTFRDMARAFSSVESVTRSTAPADIERAQRVVQGLQDAHTLRVVLSQLREIKLEVGSDGRNRTYLAPFGARTGRNQPSTNKFIFGPAVWLRGLIKPPPGYAVSYLDWRSQEFGIAAVLSGDVAMWLAYISGDVYLGFAIAAKLAPEGATRETHEPEREAAKPVVLGLSYSRTAEGIASSSALQRAEAQDLVAVHRRTFHRYWEWSANVVANALAGSRIHTKFGWQWRMDQTTDLNPRSIGNFPVQATGAEMLRLAVSMATEQGIEVVAPVHDAVLIMAPVDRIDQDTQAMAEIMGAASEVVLGGGKRIDVDAKTFRYPDRFMDEKRGGEMWRRVMRLLDEIDPEGAE